MKDEAIKRLREEYEDLKKNPITNIGTTVGLPDKNEESDETPRVYTTSEQMVNNKNDNSK